jgi:hypothetical protein
MWRDSNPRTYNHKCCALTTRPNFLGQSLNLKCLINVRYEWNEIYLITSSRTDVPKADETTDAENHHFLIKGLNDHANTWFD